ncbi:hypothetical protein ALC57_12721 [Trachymyrmex cornetzi]|uniref:Double jelly roll-like domain-containing protein n=1 Tax=Trachymyrmex cornetzi TaxID=471704 RepID=A0A151J0N5_9HYME|nr:hypothetical protein ALC57_12721 [Trachymyrmex cornetzi]
MENMWEDRDDVKDVLNVLGNQRKRDINGMRISPVQFLRDRELGIRGEKHGKVITEHVFDWSLLARQRVYTWLREEAKNVHKNINVDVVKDDYYWAKIIADWIPYGCKCIKIPAGSDKPSSFPITFKDINKFERLNAMSINVYGIENKQILPLRLTSDKKEKHINLLYLQDPRDDNVSHFAWIKNLSRLVRSQVTRMEHKKFFCDRYVQTGRKNVMSQNGSVFDDCNLSNVKLYLNSTFYPYDDLNLDFGKKRYVVLFDIYSRFRRAYYEIDCFETLLNVLSFTRGGPFVVIDCSRQNESVKSATVDVRIEFDCKENVPANTTAYCLIIHDRVAQYNPLTIVVRKII